MTGLRVEPYATATGPELMTRRGAVDAPTILVLLPFFHEHDRMRAFAGAAMRALEARGVATACPDMPGENESRAPLPPRLDAWRAAARAAAGEVGACAVLSIRSGGLLDALLPPAQRYRFVPATGGALVRDLRRAVAIADREAGRSPAGGGVLWLGGRELPEGLLGDLTAAEPSESAGRTARLLGDARPADLRLAGELLWRRAEPGNDIVLAQSLADDVADWMRTCVTV